MSEVKEVTDKIQELVDAETRAWDTQDVELLLSIMHEDMVWPWPPDNKSHDPATWVFPYGRYNYQRWKEAWQELFDTHDLVHNVRNTVKITVSSYLDGAFAVVDVDTLWKNKTTGEEFHWYGRAGKGYTKIKSGWKLIYHTGLLDYS